jgi:hypothetical protein
MLPRANPSRAAAQDELWSRLNVKADEVKHGPAQLEPLAEWVRGIGAHVWGMKLCFHFESLNRDM